MKTSIHYQYLPKGSARPIDQSDSDAFIENERGEFLPIPDVDDTVTYMSGDRMVARKVLTRHFGYSVGKLERGDEDQVSMYVTIVVGDVPDGEMLKRLKE